MATQWNRALLTALREFKAINGSRFRRQFGAHAWGIGRKVVNGKRTDDLVLRFYVDRKQPIARLGSRLVPKELLSLASKTGVVHRFATDIIETPRMTFEIDPETRIRPVPGGVSFGRNGSTGTLGGWCWDTTDDTIVALSNEHVLGTVAGLATLQQGSADGGTIADNRMGTTKRGIARLAPPDVNQVDCAIADVDDSDDLDLSVAEIGPAIYAIANGTHDLAVEKYGQTTRHTFGEITDVDWAGDVGVLEFEDCLFIEPIDPSDDWSNSGDSGSAVFSQTPTSGTIKPVVGLHFAGGGATGVACKIGTVFNELDLTTLCAGAFAQFLESLFGDDDEAEVESEAEGRRRRALGAMASRQAITARDFAFVSRAQHRLRPQRGLARGVQARLAATPRGKALTDAVDLHRHEMLSLLVRDGDVRRSVRAALRPLLRGAVTTEQVLGRRLAPEDLARLASAAELVQKRADGPLARVVKGLADLAQAGGGKSLGEILGV